MIIKAIKKYEYPIFAFIVFLLLGLVFDSLSDIFVIVFKIIFAFSIAIFCARNENGEKKISSEILIGFALSSPLLITSITMTSDIHLLGGASFYFLSMIFASGKKTKCFCIVSSAVMVLLEPLSVLFFIPSILLLLIKFKEKVVGILTLISSFSAFIFALIFSNNSFWSEQFSNYLFKLHIFYFSTEHSEIISQWFITAIPMIVACAFLIFEMFRKKEMISAIVLLLGILLSVCGFMLYGNTESVCFILLPVFAFASVSRSESSAAFAKLFKNHFLLYLLIIAYSVMFPFMFCSPPFDSALFDRFTYSIFRQQ